MILAGATLESAAFLGFVVPGETLVVVGGVLAGMGTLRLPIVMLVAIVGAILGDTLGYELGRHLGRPFLERHGHRAGLERVDALFARYGGVAVFLGRFAAFLRATVPFVAGASRMPYGRFVLYNAAGGSTWATLFVLLGYFLGASWPMVERWVGRVGLVLSVVAAMTLVLVVLRWRGARARRRARGRGASA